MTPLRRQRLTDAGLRIAHYLPPNAFIVRTMDAECERLENIDFVRWTAPYDAAWKIDPTLHDPETSPNPLGDPDEATVLITLHAGEPAETLFTAFSAIPGATAFDAARVGDSQVISAVLPRAALHGLAHLNAVQFIEPNAPATLRSGSAGWIIQSNITGEFPLWGMGLTGAGQIIGVIDGRIDVNHCSFVDTEPIGPTHRKILAYNTTLTPPDRHGTHVAGIVAGDNGGADGDNLKGAAYDAKIVFNTTPTLNEASMIARFELHHDQGARIHTNSWGWDHLNSYSAASRAIDVFTHEHEDDLVLVAISNGTTIRVPENAKNCLAVSAALDDPFQNFWCMGGSGPTIDGRRKPEISAPGCSILSAKWNTACSPQSLSGTSMATPAVAGMAVLTRQWFEDGYYPSGSPSPGDALTPSGALLRAMLINSSVNMTGEPGYPNDREGWGRVLADNALYFTGDPIRTVIRDVRNGDTESLSTGQMAEHTVEVLGAAEQLRVTMAFTDSPATLGTAFAPVNDLDLEVISPSGVPYRGNVFNASGVSETGGVFDAINSVEQVHIASPELGDWTVRVHAPAVNVGTQGYALAMTGDILDGDTGLGCPTDFNGDGVIDTADLGYLISAFGSAGGAADINGDGVVDTADLGLFIPMFGSTCP